MIAIGLSWVLFWGLVDVFNVEILNAALATGIVFVALGLLMGERSVK